MLFSMLILNIEWFVWLDRTDALHKTPWLVLLMHIEQNSICRSGACFNIEYQVLS